MEEKVKQKLVKTTKVKDFVVGYQHKIVYEDPEYYALLMMKDKDKMIVDDETVERFFQSDYKKALETARNDSNFDKLQEDQKVEILTNLIRNGDSK
jgi:hypothetical protein